ncbi:lipocalin-like domain-containing protein [Parafrankia sp. FMc2]|uniref:lipocalin-like domain-containing protein n=1 Tax=Parafrankia sp. FMc2 TaxID=3233196 RepID=UPI0034D76FBE
MAEGSPAPLASPGQLVGTWLLEAYVDVGDDGRTAPGPLGDRPRGLLIYGADHHMSVTMMRAAPSRVPDGPSEAAGPAAGPPGAVEAGLVGGVMSGFMGYAGTWRLTGEGVVHEVTVASHPYLVGRAQVRQLSLGDGVLTLTGVAPAEAAWPGRRMLTWRRAGPDDRRTSRAEL